MYLYIVFSNNFQHCCGSASWNGSGSHRKLEIHIKSTKITRISYLKKTKQIYFRLDNFFKWFFRSGAFISRKGFADPDQQHWSQWPVLHSYLHKIWFISLILFLRIKNISIQLQNLYFWKSSISNMRFWDNRAFIFKVEPLSKPSRYLEGGGGCRCGRRRGES